MSIRTLAITATVCVALLVGAFLAARTVLGPGTVEPPPEVATLGRFRAVDPPHALPDLALTDLDGRPATIAGQGGGHVLLNLWATWCAPCVKEMPALDRLQAMLGGPDFRVVTLSVDRGGANQVKPFLEKLGVSRLGVLLDPPGASMRALEVRGLPTTLLIDAAGREIARFEGGAEWDHPEMVAELKRRMGAS